MKHGVIVLLKVQLALASIIVVIPSIINNEVIIVIILSLFWLSFIFIFDFFSQEFGLSKSEADAFEVFDCHVNSYLVRDFFFPVHSISTAFTKQKRMQRASALAKCAVKRIQGGHTPELL